jgi:surfeit locus 1 family protein
VTARSRAVTPGIGARSSAALAALVAALALVCAGTLALGFWQVQRLAWKEALIARVDAHLRAAPVNAPGPAEWGALARGTDEYRRVRLRGRFLPGAGTAVRASTVLGSGYWVLMPMQTDEGYRVLVNRGFVPQEMRPLARATPDAGMQEVIGLLRFSEPGGGFLLHNDPAADRWATRDVPAIASARGLAGASVAPYFIDAEAGPGAGEDTWPRAGLTVVRFTNNHRVYAITWFALALMSAAATAYVLIDARRRRAGGGEPDGVDPDR